MLANLIVSLSYVFDGQPPELKKQELAKRYLETIPFLVFLRIV